MISSSTIQNVMDAARVEEVIGDFLQLKKSGANYKGLSPFTDERTPSFSVSPVKQIWKDFSSGKGGNVIHFLMEHSHYSYPEAIRYLAKKYNIEVEETQQSDEEKERHNERESLYILNDFANKYFQNILRNDNRGKAIGWSYFKERGFHDKTIKTFELGYALDKWDVFTKHALNSGYNLKFLEKSGLSIIKENKSFDRFKGRVIFPIQSISGRVLGFGGRILDSTKSVAKYVNSPESEVYKKSQTLYGIYQAKQSISKEENCYLVEGYTDVIQMYQTGIHNVVASGGTALTKEQIRLLQRFTKKITILYDGDLAGQEASMRGIDLILEQGMSVFVCALPEGEDPDSFSHKISLEGLTSFLKENSQDFITYKASLLHRCSNGDSGQKAEIIRDIINSISKVNDRIQQELYVKSCAKIVEISEEVLFSTLAQLEYRNAKKSQKRTAETEPALEIVSRKNSIKKVDRQLILEQTILEILLLHGDQKAEFTDLIIDTDPKSGEAITKTHTEVRYVWEKINLYLQEDELEFSEPLFHKIYTSLIDNFRISDSAGIDKLMDQHPKSSEFISSIVMSYEKYRLDNWESKNIFTKDRKEKIAQLIQDTILEFRRLMVYKILEDLQEQSKTKQCNTSDILEQVRDYHQLNKLISEKLGNRIFQKM